MPRTPRERGRGRTCSPLHRLSPKAGSRLSHPSLLSRGASLDRPAAVRPITRPGVRPTPQSIAPMTLTRTMVGTLRIHSIRRPLRRRMTLRRMRTPTPGPSLRSPWNPSRSPAPALRRLGSFPRNLCRGESLPRSANGATMISPSSLPYYRNTSIL